MKILSKTVSILLIFLSFNNTLASTDKKGSFLLNEIFFTHQIIADSKPSSIIDKKIPGSIILLNEKKYEVVSFIFEDTLGKINDKTFAQYSKENNLLGMRSILITPYENISFEVFDSNNSHLDDGVYFYLSIRPLKVKNLE